MGRSLTGLVTSLFAASTLAVAPGCNKVGQWLDEDSPGSSNLNLENNPLAPALKTLDTAIKSVGGTITYYRGSDGKLYVENVTLPESCNRAKDSPQSTRDVPSPVPGPASSIVPGLTERVMTQGESNYDDAKAALTDDKRNIHIRVVTHSDKDPEFSKATVEEDPATIICYVQGPPGKPKEPEKPKAPPEGCPYTIWKEYPRPSRQNIIDDIFNAVLRGKTIKGIEALTADSADNLYSQLAAKFMMEYTDAIDNAISKRVDEVRLYDNLREKSETRDVNGVNVKVGYSVQGDRYTANGKDFASKVNIDKINDSNVRAGIKGKLIAALKGGALRFYNNHFYHKYNFNSNGEPTTSPATAVTIPNANYSNKSFDYAAQDRIVLDTTSLLCKPQSVDPTSTPLDQCGVGVTTQCQTDVK
ncbi:hypothetical protein HYY69_05350 [Candidatus Woesearchaeota archaeon]|nr:hypothetical protein [Candidatus Woesearchaeota archaeon]